MRGRLPYELFRVDGSPFWYVYFRLPDGGRFRRSTKEADRGRAHAVARDLERRLADPSYQAADETTIGDACVHLADHLENRGRAPATRRFYAQKVGHVKRLFGADAALSAVTAKAVDGYITTRRREGAHRHTVAKELTALRMLLKVARRRGEYAADPAAVMPVGYDPGYEPRTRRVTIEEAWALIGRLPPGPAKYAAFVCATTCRDAGVSRAIGKDFAENSYNGYIQLRDFKTKSASRKVPITLITRPFAEFAFEGVAPEAAVAPGVGSVRHAFDRAARALGLAHVSPNDLRRSVSHWHLQAGVPRDIVAAFMGHASTKMLDRVYGRLDPEEIGAAMARALGE